MYPHSNGSDISHGARQRLLAYLGSVYPAAVEQLNACSTRQLNHSFKRLDYLFACNVRGLRPPLAVPSCPALPFMPAGAFYSTSGRNARSVYTFSGGHYFRFPEPIEVHGTARRAAAVAATHSSFGGRAGPAPAWTSPLARVRYPLYPLGLIRRQDDASSDQQALHSATHSILPAQDHVLRPMRVGARAATRWGQAAHANVSAHPRVAALFHLRDGDLLEVEQWGGWLDAGACPPICGLWANVWHGTGVGLRVATPFTSLNKGTAVVEMIRAIGRRNTSVLPALATKLTDSIPSLAGPVLDVRSRWPDAAASEVLAAAVLAQHPCVGTDESHRFGPVMNAWLDFVKSTPPDEVVRQFLRLGSGAGGPPHYGNDAMEYANLWLFGACGIGANHWDQMLGMLACVLGHRTVILAASSNDNGLLHQEVVDYELPTSLGWPRIDRYQGRHGALNDISACLPFRSDPGRPPVCTGAACQFAWVQEDLKEGRQLDRRQQLLAFLRESKKFRLPAMVPDGVPVVRAATATRSSRRCVLSFGGGAARRPEGRLQACSYSFPQGLETKESAGKDCWAWCGGTLSASNAEVSLVHSRVPGGYKLTELS